MTDDDRGRTHAASCATCRWWQRGDDTWGDCLRADDDEDLPEPSPMRAGLRLPAAMRERLWGVAVLETEAAFGCRAWEPRRDSGPQDAPDSAQGSDVPVPGLPSRGGAFPAARASVLHGQGGGE